MQEETHQNTLTWLKQSKNKPKAYLMKASFLSLERVHIQLWDARSL